MQVFLETPWRPEAEVGGYSQVKELNFYIASGMGLYNRYRDLMQGENFPA